MEKPARRSVLAARGLSTAPKVSLLREEPPPRGRKPGRANGRLVPARVPPHRSLDRSAALVRWAWEGGSPKQGRRGRRSAPRRRGARWFRQNLTQAWQVPPRLRGVHAAVQWESQDGPEPRVRESAVSREVSGAWEGEGRRPGNVGGGVKSATTGRRGDCG